MKERELERWLLLVLAGLVFTALVGIACGQPAPPRSATGSIVIRRIPVEEDGVVCYARVDNPTAWSCVKVK